MVTKQVIEHKRKNISYQSFSFTNKCPSDCLKDSIKIYIKTATTCFDVTDTPSSGNGFFELAKVTVVKIAIYGTPVFG